MALTPWQQNIVNQAKTTADGSRQGTVQDMVELAGLPPTKESYETVIRVLSEAGEEVPALTRAMNQGQLALAAGAGNKPLTAYQQNVYDSAKASGASAQDIATSYNDRNIPVRTQDVLDILYGAGLGGTLGTKPNNSPGVTATGPAKTPQPPEYDGGMPGRQPSGGGMYGAAAINPPNIAGQIPNSPSLRGVFNHARRQSKPGWRGQTDKILTSGRGVLDSAVLRKKVLLGS